jgi:hypothetical protein
LDDAETDMLDAQVGAAADSESRMLLKTISDSTQLVTATRIRTPMCSRLTALSQTDWTAPDFGITTGHSARC